MHQWLESFIPPRKYKWNSIVRVSFGVKSTLSKVWRKKQHNDSKVIVAHYLCWFPYLFVRFRSNANFAHFNCSWISIENKNQVFIQMELKTEMRSQYVQFSTQSCEIAYDRWYLSLLIDTLKLKFNVAPKIRVLFSLLSFFFSLSHWMMLVALSELSCIGVIFCVSDNIQ